VKHAVIVTHPNAESFTGTMAKAYCDAAAARGETVIVRDLYRLEFDPRLHADEIPWSADYRVHDDVAAERAALAGADVFALFYPLWVNAAPAMLKGYIERVFGAGFGYKPHGGGNLPLLTGRMLISVTSSGAPMAWVKETGAWQALRTLFDAHFAAVCGLEIVDHLHFGGIVPGTRPDVVARHAAQVRDRVAALARPAP